NDQVLGVRASAIEQRSGYAVAFNQSAIEAHIAIEVDVDQGLPAVVIEVREGAAATTIDLRVARSACKCTATAPGTMAQLP
ncbi:hypothetical protein, partial [Dokdonella sp.]|uniref:hypothetical protein n=1 Tax=Dokdonella sp. TaxID=2291710 RepID=UPI002BDE8FD4